MSISASILNGLSGLRASQAGLNVISQNVANANTEGYVRARVNLSPQVTGSLGAGVSVDAITRATDRFLAEAHRTAEAARGAADRRSAVLDRAQAALGDPTGSATLFASLDDAFAAFDTLALRPTDAVARRTVISNLETLFSDVATAARQIEDLRAQADLQIGDSVTEVNDLLGRIASLNREALGARSAGGNATGAENARDVLIDRLAEIVDIRVTQSSSGLSEVRTTAGALLVGNEAATLTYTPGLALYGEPGTITLNAGSPSATQFEPLLSGGELKGLLTARDSDLPALSAALGELAAGTADAINEAHAATAGNPAKPALTGRQTGLLGTDALGFSGTAVIGVLDSGGGLERRLTIDFDAGTLTTENPADTRAFAATIDGLTAALDAALNLAPDQGGASFTGGVLSITGGSGVVVGDVAGDESARQGRTFGHFFGLNDLVRSQTPTFFEVGAAATDAHGLAAGGALSLEVRDQSGRVVASRSVTPGGTDWASFVNDINTGVSGYGQARFTAEGGIELAANSGYSIAVTGDTTRRGATGVSASALFGLSRASTAGRALNLTVDSAIKANANYLGAAKPDLTAAIDTRILEGGDSRGAQALAGAASASREFAATPGLAAQTTTLSLFAARVGGEASRLANVADRAREGAEAVASAATQKRAQVEGVSIDDELVRMTQFQQSYAAASRVIQAAKEMYDVLLSIR